MEVAWDREGWYLESPPTFFECGRKRAPEGGRGGVFRVRVPRVWSRRLCICHRWDAFKSLQRRAGAMDTRGLCMSAVGKFWEF